MTTTSAVHERWELAGRGIDAETGLPFALVAREKFDFDRRITMYKLLKRDNSWYNVGQFISKRVFRHTPERNGVKLTNSRLDTILRDFAEKGYSENV